MNEDVRTERVIRDWLDAAAPPPPDRVVDRVLAALPTIGQQSAGLMPRIVLSPLRALEFAAVAAAVAILLFAAVNRSPILEPGATPSHSPGIPSANPTVAPTAGLALLPADHKATIDVGTETWAIVADARSVWFEVEGVGMGRIDRSTHADTGLRVPAGPGMTFAGGQLWAVSDATGLLRLDPVTGEVLQAIPGVSGGFVVVDGTTAWVTGARNAVDRVDLVAGEIVARIEVPEGPKQLAVADGSVWVACSGGRTIVRIDATTNDITAQIPDAGGPANLVVGEGAVWVWSDGQLLRVDPRLNAIVARIDGTAAGPAAGLAVGGGFVWVAVPEGIGRVDPATDRIDGVIPLGPVGSWNDIVYVDGELFVSTVDGNVIHEIDPTP